jgi:hypothetical protein
MIRSPGASPRRRPRGDNRVEPDNVVRLPGGPERATASATTTSPERWKGVAEPGSEAARGLDEIAKVEPSFDARGFVEGSKAAYEMIVTAFAQGDRKTLKNLLSRDVFDGFERAITERERRGEKAETTFVSIDRAEIAGVEVRNRVAQITVRFLSKLITATRDSGGRVVDGKPRRGGRRHRRLDLRPHPRHPRSQLAARRDRSGAMTRARRRAPALAVPGPSVVASALGKRAAVLALAVPMTAGAALPAEPRRVGDARLEPVAFADLAGWAEDDHAAAFAAFRRTCEALASGRPSLRPAAVPAPDLAAICREALKARRPPIPKASSSAPSSPFESCLPAATGSSPAISSRRWRARWSGRSGFPPPFSPAPTTF